MKRVSLLTVIVLTVFDLVSVSAQKEAYGSAISDSAAYIDSIRSSDSQLVHRYINLSRQYLGKNIDSSVYWADAAITLAAQKNNWLLLNQGLEMERNILQYDLQKKQNENELLKRQNESDHKYSTILAVSAIFVLLGSVYFAVLYRQKNNMVKNLENYKLEAEQQNIEIANLQKKTEEKNNELAKVNTMKDKLIPMIAHDIRSPLASLQTTLSLTRENILNPEEFQKLSFALEADIYNLRGMLDNMLLWTREQIVEIKINKSQFNLSEMVQHVILMHRNTLITKNINIHNYLQPCLDVFSDKEMLTAVFRNVFSNAVKFTQPGKNIYIHQIFLNKKIYLSVKDEGAGISEEVLAKINNKEHISTRGTANEKGTGIGIIFGKDLLSKLGEILDITSLPGQGTSVTFSINLNNHEAGTNQTS